MSVRTVLGDIDASDLGVTYAHEHLIIDSPVVAERWPHIHLDSADDAVEELTECADVGVGAVIDAMPTGSGRDVGRLMEISRRSGVHIVAATGMHTSKYYPGADWIDDDPDQLAVRFASEICVDADGTSGRCGVMKVATSSETPTSRERRLFEAAGMVHAETGVAVLTHCEDGLGALQQLEMIDRHHIDRTSVILSHTDKVTDGGYHREILSTGVNVEYDQALRRHLTGSHETAELCAEMWAAGHGSQILFGTDGARRSLWSSLGGRPGLAWLWTDFTSILEDHGLDEEAIRTMFVSNPARVLSM